MHNNIIIGLAGHIDHGKTAIIKALNNYDGDQRIDERTQGITLEPSYSNLIINNINLSFIDVPGHEKLVKYMIGASAGIDALLLVIDANEGLKTQTIEHINIAKMMNINSIVVAINKIDLLNQQDEQYLNKINTLKEEISSILKDFKAINIVETSIYIPQTINKLKDTLAHLKPKTKDNKILKYYIDRVFSKKGFGSIITGTLLSGTININDKLYVCNIKQEAHIRNIEHHNIKEETGYAGQRLALNINNIDASCLKRGYLLSKKNVLRGFKKLDVYIKLFNLSSPPKELYFFIGTYKTKVHINILEQLKEGEFLAELHPKEEIYTSFKEKFILADGIKSIGGGFILSPIIDPIKKSYKVRYLKSLMHDNFCLAFNELIKLHYRGFGLISSLQRFNLTHEEALIIAKQIEENEGNIFIDADNLIIYQEEAKISIHQAINNLIIKNPKAIFSPASIRNISTHKQTFKYPSSTIKRREESIKWASMPFIIACFKENKSIKAIDKNLYVSIHNPINHIKDIDKELNALTLKEIKLSNFTPSAPIHLASTLSIDLQLLLKIINKLVATKEIIKLKDNVYVHHDSLNNMILIMKKIIEQKGFINIELLKEKEKLSRKYLFAYLDYLETLENIKREDNKRMLLSPTKDS